MSRRFMKGQATVEFILFFLFALVFVTLLISGMGLAQKRAAAESEIIQKSVALEEMARTIEAHSNTGLVMVIGTGQFPYRISGDRIETDHQGGVIVANGIFGTRGARYEPI